MSGFSRLLLRVPHCWQENRHAWPGCFARALSTPVASGVAVDDTAVLIAYTRTGDANLDGVVDDNDVTIVGATYAPGVSQPHWALGDFDYNGFVDDDDVTLLGVFYAPAQGGPPAAALKGPEDRNEVAPTVRSRADVANAVYRSEGPTQDSSRSAGPTDLIHQELDVDPGPDGPGYYLPPLRAYETFAPTDVRGPETRTRQETRAQQQAPIVLDDEQPDDDLVDLLAQSIVAEAAGRGAKLYDPRLVILNKSIQALDHSLDQVFP